MWSVRLVPTAVNLSFLDRSRHFFIQIAPQLSTRVWFDAVPDQSLLKKSGSARVRIRVVWVCNQELWQLDHRCGAWFNPGRILSNSVLTRIQLGLALQINWNASSRTVRNFVHRGDIFLMTADTAVFSVSKKEVVAKERLMSTWLSTLQCVVLVRRKLILRNGYWRREYGHRSM
jgi:hypothetical protein